VPVVLATMITVIVLRGAKNDPDERRFRRLAEQRRSAEKDVTPDER
jgi:hypothetical protein